MNIVIIGSGNVATVLGRKMVQSGHRILQVFNRNPVHAGILAQELKATSVSVAQKLDLSAELYVIAVSDNAIGSVAALLQLENQLVVHTAGSVPMHILKNVSSGYGVLYPLQRIRKELDMIPEIPFLVDASSEYHKELLYQFASGLSGKVQYAQDQERLYLHLAAVITSNFSNHLYALAEDYCREKHVDFKMLVPLLRETTALLDQASPSALQTGPAIRRDDTTIQKHRELLDSNPVLLKMYNLFTESIQNLT